jgi:hypothetical protein
MSFSRSLGSLVLGLSLALAACGGSSGLPKDAAIEKTPDAKPDAGASDAAVEMTVDAPVETTVDAPAEAATDAPAEAATDAPAEAATDAPAEAATDAPAEKADAGSDAATDAGSDAGSDASAGTLFVYNTGVDSTGAVLAGGAVDPHYTLIQSADNTLPGPNAIVVGTIAAGYWLANDTKSKWIAPSTDQVYPGPSPCNTAGTYVYRTTFDLTGRDPSALRLAGRWVADNSGTAVRLNGNSLGFTVGGYGTFADFTISSGFAAGKNNLDFEILDTGCPNGLRVELTATWVTDAGTDASSDASASDASGQ